MIDGWESFGYWFVSMVVFYVNVDIVGVVLYYVWVIGDQVFECEVGFEMFVEMVWFWVFFGYVDFVGVFYIYGVIGFDEYFVIVDDNVYMNFMVQWNLCGVVVLVWWYLEVVGVFGVDEVEFDEWCWMVDVMCVLFDEVCGVYLQLVGFMEQECWDFESMSFEEYFLQEYFFYFDLYWKQVVKQVDLVFVLFFVYEVFIFEEKECVFGYYEEFMVWDFLFFVVVQVIIVVEVGQFDFVYDYLVEVVMFDFDDLYENMSDGLYIVVFVGVWMVIMVGFGGMRDIDDGLWFLFCLLDCVCGLNFGVWIYGQVFCVEVLFVIVIYVLKEGLFLIVWYFDVEVEFYVGYLVIWGIFCV